MESEDGGFVTRQCSVFRISFFLGPDWPYSLMDASGTAVQNVAYGYLSTTAPIGLPKSRETSRETVELNEYLGDRAGPSFAFGNMNSERARLDAFRRLSQRQVQSGRQKRKTIIPTVPSSHRRHTTNREKT